MKIPVKDEVTIPWMSTREIPAVKLMLSAWRKMRKDKYQVSMIRDTVLAASPQILDTWISNILEKASWDMETITVVNERVKKEKQ